MGTVKFQRGVLKHKNKHENVVKTVHVSASTKFAAALKRIDKALNSKDHATCRVLGMGRSIQTVLQICAGLKVRGYSLKIRTLSLKCVDEYVNEERGTSSIQHRNVPAVEVIVARM